MELELGLKITRTREDVSSSVDFYFSKDPFGPLVLSQETDSRFIIIIHLKGFKKEGVEIDINNEGNRITVRGRKPVEEMVMIRWMTWRKEVEFRVFRKVFRIPDIVDLDKIKARFDDDDATLTITMPKRVKGVSGFKIEEEEEEERVESGEVEEESIEREESDEHFETEIERDEEFGERESQVLEEEQKDEEETEDDNLEKIDQIYEQDKTLECIQEEEEELAHSNKEKEDSSLRKLPEIEGRDSHEQTIHEEQELEVKQQAETKNDDFGSRVLEEIGDLEPDVLDRKSKSREMEKEMADDDDSYGLSTVQEIEEPERHNEERKIREMVETKDEEETEDDNLKKIHQIDEQDYKILEYLEKEEEEEEEEETTGLQELADSNTESEDSSLRKLPDTEGRDSHEQKRHDEQVNKVVEKQDSKAETNSEDFGSRAFEEIEEQEPDEQLDRKIESGGTEKKTTDDDGDALSKFQGIEEAERHNEERNIQEMVEVETGGHENKKIVKMEFKNRDAKEEVDGKMGEGIRPNINRTQVVGEDDTADTEAKAEEFESDEVDKIHELVEKKEEKGENANVGRKSEEKSLIKLKEKKEQNSKGQKPHSKQENIKELLEEKTPLPETNIGNDILKPVQETEVPEVDTLGKRVDEGKDKKKNVKMEIKNGDAKEEVDAKMGEVFTPNIAETEAKTEEFESDQLKADEVDKIQKLVEKKEKDEENAKVGAQSEDIGEQQFQGQKREDKQEKIIELVEEKTPETEATIGNDIPKLVQDRCEEIKKQPEEYKEKIMETEKKIHEAAARKVQETIRQQELDEPSRCVKESKTQELVKSKTNDEEKIAETETKEQESYRPKILREQEKIEELAAEKTKLSKNRKVQEEEEIAEKKTKFGDDYDDISRKVQDIEQRDSEAIKGQEEKDMIQELVLEEKLSDEGKGIIAEVETKAENDKLKRVQEIDEQQSHEEDTCGKQFQKLIGEEISVLGEVEDVEKEKKITEAEKRINDSPREAQEIGKKDSDVSEEYRGIYRKEHEEEKKDEADRPGKITGIEQELVNLNSRLGQDNVEDGEKTQELVEEKIKDCKEEEASEESKANTDDVVRKVQGIKEQDLYEPKGEHVRKIKELVEEKTGDHEKVEGKEIAESQIEAECGSLKKIDCSEEHDLHEPKIHKERDKTRIAGAEEPSGEEIEEDEENIAESMKITENENSTHVKDFEEERPDKPESNEKRHKIQEVVEAGHNGRKEEKVIAKAELETEKESSKKVQETEQQEYDRVKRSMVQDKMEEKEKIRATEEKAIRERRTETKDDSLKSIRDDEDPELSKPYKRQQEDKIQELVEMGTSDYREKVKKLDDDDILKSQEAGRPDIDEFEKHGEPSNIPQLVGEEKLEKISELRGKMEDDSSGKFHEFEEVKMNEDWTHEEQEKREDLVKEEVIVPKYKHTVGEGHDDHKEKQQDEKVANTELKTEEDSSKEVQEIEKEECNELKRYVVHDKMQETEETNKTREMEENEIVERRKKTKDGNLRKVRGDEDTELSKPYIRPEIDEEKVENNAELGEKMEDDSSCKFLEFEERKSYEDWTYEQQEKRKDLVKEEATDLKDRHTGGKGHNDHKEEQQEEKVIAKADIGNQELQSEEDRSKKVREIEKEENNGLKISVVEDKMREAEDKEKSRAMEENEIVARREKTKDGSLRKVREGEDDPQLGRHKRHWEEDRIQNLVERQLSDHREKVKKKDEEDISRSKETEKLDLGELERHCKQRKIHQSVEDEKGEGKMENIPELGEKMKADSSGKVHELQKQKSYEDWIEEESEEIENLVKAEATGPKDKLTGREGEHEEERYEKVAETTTKVEDGINTNAGEKKEPESDKKERYRKLDKLDDFTTKIQETEKEESHELEMHEKLDIVSDFVEDETGDQEDEEAEEAAAVVASNESGSSRKVQTIEEQSEKHKQQNKIPETSDPKMQEEDEERLAEKDTEELTAHVQELEGKTENSKGDNGEERRGEKGKQGKTAETKSDDGIVKKIREAKVKESNESKNQERKGTIEELERKESSNHKVKLVTEDDSLGKGQEYLEKEANVSKRRPVEEEKFQELKEVGKRDQVNEDEEKAEAETKINDGKSRKFEMSKMLELDESKENEEQKRFRKPMEEKSADPKIEKEGNEKIAEDEIDSRIEDQEIKGQEPYELLRSGEHDKIPQCHREEEKVMELRDVSSRKVQQIKAQEPDELEKHGKPSEIPEKHNIQESVKEEIQEYREEEMNEGRESKPVVKTKPMASSESQDIEERGSDHPKKYAEQEQIQELMTEEGGKKENHMREEENIEKAKTILQVESKADDHSSEKNETEGHESTGLRGEKKKENHQELVETETSDQRKEEKEDEEVEKAEKINEYVSPRKIHEHEERKSDKMSENFAAEETEQGGVLGEVETKIGKVKETDEQEEDKKKSFVEKDTSGKAKENKKQETKSRDDSSRKMTQENENQESLEQRRNEEQDKKKLELVEKKTNHCRNEEDANEDKEIPEAEVPRKLKQIEKQESTKMVKRHENQELVEEKMNNQEGENKNSMITEVLEKAEDHESKGPEGQRKQDKRWEQRLRDKLKDEETAMTETKSKDNESRKIHQTIEQETSEQGRINESVEDRTHCRDKENIEKAFEDGSSKKIQEIDKDEETKSKGNESRNMHKIKEQETSEQGRINELVESRTHDCRETEFEDGNSKKIQEIAKEESVEPRRDEKREKIKEPVDRETSEDDEEELEVEFEDEEEDWEAEVIQDMDSDEDNEKIRQIKRIRLGFRLVGGSTLFMSLIVIVISFIRSKRKIRCYKF